MQSTIVQVFRSVDFMRDYLVNGRTFRAFGNIDDFNSVAFWNGIDTLLPVLYVIRVLDRLVDK